jgi:hypothetical protein
MGVNSAIAIGEFDHDSFELEGPLIIVENTSDEDYPLSLNGVTVGGHDVSISLSKGDVDRMYIYFS